jgi:hypothetical protein
LAKALTLVAIAQDAGAIEIEWLTPDGTAFELRPSHAGAHSLDDQVSFQFRDGSDDDYDGATQWAAGVDLFAERDELDVEAVQLVQSFKEVFHRSGDPVRGPDQDHIEAAAAGVGHHFVETRSPGFDSGDSVCILRGNLIAALRGHLLEIKQLRFRMLVNG